MSVRRAALAAAASAGGCAACLGIALASPLLGPADVLAGTGALEPWFALLGAFWLAWWPEVVMLAAPILGTALIRMRG